MQVVEFTPHRRDIRLLPKQLDLDLLAGRVQAGSRLRAVGLGSLLLQHGQAFPHLLADHFQHPVAVGVFDLQVPFLKLQIVQPAPHKIRRIIRESRDFLGDEGLGNAGQHLLNIRHLGHGGRQFAVRLGDGQLHGPDLVHHRLTLLVQRADARLVLEALHLSFGLPELVLKAGHLLFEELLGMTRGVDHQVLLQVRLDERVQDVPGKFRVFLVVGQGDDVGVLKGLNLQILDDRLNGLLAVRQRLHEAQALGHIPRDLIEPAGHLVQGGENLAREPRRRRGDLVAGRGLSRIVQEHGGAHAVDHPFGDLAALENLQLRVDLPVVGSIDLGDLPDGGRRIQTDRLPSQSHQQTRLRTIHRGPQESLDDHHPEQQKHEGRYLRLVAEHNVQGVTQGCLP